MSQQLVRCNGRAASLSGSFKSHSTGTLASTTNVAICSVDQTRPPVALLANEVAAVQRRLAGDTIANTRRLWRQG